MSTKITDVARYAGVSMKTVSRVLNNEPNVRQKTREKVKAAIKALHYRPNLAARGLAGTRSYLLALLYDNPSGDYIANIQRGASESCRLKRYHLMVEPLDMSGKDFYSDMELLLERLPVDGVILTPPLSDSQALMDVLMTAKIPYVRIGNVSFDNTALNIAMDDKAATFEMTQYLIESGHKRIGFIKGDKRHCASKLRYEGFENAMHEAGLTVDPNIIAQGDFTFISGQTCAHAILSQSPRPSAIFASNDEMAAGVYSAAWQMGLSVPENISVCGFDDTKLAEVLSPGLTTIRQPIVSLGKQAARYLIDKRAKLNNPEETKTSVTLDYELVRRSSIKVIRG